MRAQTSPAQSGGFRPHLDHLVDCKAFRGEVAAHAIKTIWEDWVVTPAILGRARGQLHDYQTVKWGWHCFARFGLGERTAAKGPVTFQPNGGKVVVSGTSAFGDDFQIADLHSADEQASGFGNYKRRTSLTLRHQSCMEQHFYQEIANCDAFVMLATGWNTVELPEKMEARQAVQNLR